MYGSVTLWEILTKYTIKRSICGLDPTCFSRLPSPEAIWIHKIRFIDHKSFHMYSCDHWWWLPAETYCSILCRYFCNILLMCTMKVGLLRLNQIICVEKTQNVLMWPLWPVWLASLSWKFSNLDSADLWQDQTQTILWGFCDGIWHLGTCFFCNILFFCSKCKKDVLQLRYKWISFYLANSIFRSFHKLASLSALCWMLWLSLIIWNFITCLPKSHERYMDSIGFGCF